MVASLGEVGEQVMRDLLHFLGQQRGAEDFGDAQHALHLVQVLVALQQRDVFRLLDECFERGARFVELVVELAGDEMQRLR